jgi:hypothetical protein
MQGRPQFDLQPSYFLALLLVFIHLGAMAILFFLSFKYSVILIFSIFCISHLSFTLWHTAFRFSSRGIIRLSPQRDGSWLLFDRAGEVWNGELQNDSIRSRYFILLIFKVSGKRFSVPLILPWDVLDKQNFRRLRVNLLL